MKQSGGDVRIRSRVGKGTRVEVLLPCTAEQPTESAPPESAVAPRRRREETILVAEDEPIVAGLVRAVLSQEGYRVVVARNGAEALELAGAEEGGFDLLLTDVIMPVMSGPELVKQLREREPALPVLFMSGYTEDILVEHGFRIEEVDLLRKPFSRVQLLTRVRQFLEARAG